MPETQTLEIREFIVAVRAEAEGEARTVTGLAVPYGQIIERYDWEHGTEYERFEAGSVEDHPDGVMYFYGHNEPIGLQVSSRDIPAGHEITASISATARGDEVYTLLKDGVLTKHSIGFYPVESRVDKFKLSDDGPEVDVLTRTKVLKREVSVVPFPAYSQAGITEVRSRPTDPKENRMPPTAEPLTRDDLASLEARLTEIDRQVAVIADGGTRGDSAELPFASYGDFLKALAKGDRSGVEIMNRAYAGAVTGDTTNQPGWIERDIKLVEVNRPIVNLFNRDALGPEGMTLEYPTFTSKSGDVAAQAAEGDDLTYMELVLGTATAPVGTYGAYSRLTRQIIDRMPASYVNKVLRMQKISYAKNTNGIVRTRLTGATGTNTVIDISAGVADADVWIGGAIDAVSNIESNSVGLSLEGFIASTAQFKALAAVVDGDGRPVFVVNGDGSNSIGGVDIRGLKANIAGIPVTVDPGLTGLHMYGYSSEALTVLEAPGAPFALDDENIINLSKDFSLYGYLASTLDDAKGIQKVKVLAA